MSSPFVAEIRIFPFNFAPTGWAFCDGQILPLSQNTALFSLLGTTYGGDGKSNFALPNLQGNVPLHVGANQPGPSGTVYDLGEVSGEEGVNLLQSEMPFHGHTMMAELVPANSKVPAATEAIGRSSGGNVYLPKDGNLGVMDPSTVYLAGGGLPHNNLMPYLVLNFCIALQGVFPPRG